MTTVQWLFAITIASVLAILIQVLGGWTAKLLRKHSPGTWPARVARFVVFFVFFLYSVIRTLNPTLDQHFPPIVFMIGWVIIGGVALQLIVRDKEPRVGLAPPKADSFKVD